MIKTSKVQRRTWQTPALKRLAAGSAEISSVTNVDAPGGSNFS